MQFCDALLDGEEEEEDAAAGAGEGQGEGEGKGSSLTSQPPATLLQQRWQGLRGDPQFWELLRRGLADPQAGCRKRAAHVLQAALPRGPTGAAAAAVAATPLLTVTPLGLVLRSLSPACLTLSSDTRLLTAASTSVPPRAGPLAPAWHCYLWLLDCLDERSPHLVLEGWSEGINVLHPPAAPAAPVPCAVVAAAQPSLSALPQPKPQSQPSPSKEPSPMSWPWLEVLWARGLRHENPQVSGVEHTRFPPCAALDPANPP